MIKFLGLLGGIVFTFLLFVPSTQAHFLASDNGVSAILHIEPNDDPLAKQPATFYLDFGTVQNKFNLQQCACVFTIAEQGNVLFTKKLSSQASNKSIFSTNVTYTLPQKDVYLIQVKGIPLDQNSFQPFLLSWNIRVDKVGQPVIPGWETMALSIFAVLAVIFIVGLFVKLVIFRGRK